MKTKLKIGQAVLITKGMFFGKFGRIIDLEHKNNTIRIKVSGVNIGRRTIQPTYSGTNGIRLTNGQRIEAERWINISSVQRRRKTDKDDYQLFNLWLVAIFDRNETMKVFKEIKGSLEDFKKAEDSLKKGIPFILSFLYDERWPEWAVDKKYFDITITKNKDKPVIKAPAK